MLRLCWTQARLHPLPIRECQTNVILAQLLSINVNSLRTNVTVGEQALSAIFPRIVSLVFLYSF